MFAIRMNEQNFPKILQTPTLSILEAEGLTYWFNQDRYFIRGYIDPKGRLKDWTTLPIYLLQDNFDFDPIKIQTDWDQIVRK